MDKPAGYRDRAMLEVLYGSGGLRVSELVGGLNVGDIDPMGFVRCLGKGGKERIIPLGGSHALTAAFKYLRHARPKLQPNPGETALFLNTRGGRLTRQGFWKIIRHWAKQAGITRDISPPICCAIRLPPICCATGGRICAPFKRCWAMLIWLQPRFILI